MTDHQRIEELEYKVRYLMAQLELTDKLMSAHLEREEASRRLDELVNPPASEFEFHERLGEAKQ